MEREGEAYACSREERNYVGGNGKMEGKRIEIQRQMSDHFTSSQ